MATWKSAANGGTPVWTLKRLSPRAKHGLKEAGIRTLEQAVKLSDADLLAIPGLKQSSLLRLREWQNNPDAPERPARGNIDREREERLWEAYLGKINQGVNPALAATAAVDAVETFYQRLGQEAGS